MTVISTEIRWADNTQELAANLKSGLDQIEAMKTSADRLATSLGGDGLFKAANNLVAAIDQLGGVTKLTEAEQERANATLDNAIAKYQAMGLQAPSAMVALAAATQPAADSTNDLGDAAASSFGAFLGGIPVVGAFIAALSVERVVSFVAQLIESTTEIGNLSRSLGVSTTQFQQLTIAGEDFGVGTDTMARGVETLSQKLSSGNTSAVAAVGMLGLNIQQLIAEGPMDAFLDIADAVGTIQDPMMRAEVASDLFSTRLANSLLPTLADLRTTIAGIPQSQIISDSNILAVQAFDIAWTHAKGTLENVAIDLVAQSATAMLLLSAAIGSTTKTVSQGDIQLTSSTQLWQNLIDGLTAKQAALTSVNVDQIASENALGATVQELATHYGLSTEAVSSLIDAHKKFAAAEAEVQSAGQGWQGTLETINADTIAAIENDLKAGVSQAALATYYQLTATQVKAVASAVSAQTDAQKAELAIEAQVAAASDAYYKAVGAASHNTVAAQVADAYEAADARVAAMDKAKSYSIEAEMLIWAAADQTASNIIQKTLESDQYTREHYQLIMDQADAAYQFALDHSDSYTQEEIQNLLAADRAATLAFNHWSQAATDAMDQAQQKAKGTAAAVATSVISVMDSLSMADAAMNDGLDSTIKNIETLSGMYVTALNAKIAFDTGGTSDIPTVTVTDQNKASLVAELQSIEADYVMNPGRAPDGNGSTGLQPDDAVGWSAMLQEQVRYESLKAALPGFGGGVEDFAGGWATVGELGPETLYLPPGANVAPTDLSPIGGGETHIAVNVSGVWDARSKQELTDAVGETIMRRGGFR